VARHTRISGAIRSAGRPVTAADVTTWVYTAGHDQPVSTIVNVGAPTGGAAFAIVLPESASRLSLPSEN
jgi:hypothetical protein